MFLLFARLCPPRISNLGPKREPELLTTLKCKYKLECKCTSKVNMNTIQIGTPLMCIQKFFEIMYNLELISNGTMSFKPYGRKCKLCKIFSFLGSYSWVSFPASHIFSHCLKRLPPYFKTITSMLLKCSRLPSFYLMGNWTLDGLRARMGHKNKLKLAQYEIQIVKLNIANGKTGQRAEFCLRNCF